MEEVEGGQWPKSQKDVLAVSGGGTGRKKGYLNVSQTPKKTGGGGYFREKEKPGADSAIALFILGSENFFGGIKKNLRKCLWVNVGIEKSSC